MININTVFGIVKYAIAIWLVVVIVMAPAWIAANNGKAGMPAKYVRVANWLFGWTGVGWLVALFWSARK